MIIAKTPISCQEILERFPDLFIGSVGDLQQTITSVQAPDNATDTGMVFLATPKAFAAGIKCAAPVLVVSKKLQATAEAERGSRTLLIAKNVEVAMANVISEVFLKTPYTNPGIHTIHPSAVVMESAKIHPSARIGPNAFVGSGVILGEGVYIGANSVIEDGVEIGAHTVIHPQVFIGHSCLLGSRCEIHPQSVVGKEGFGYAHDERWNHHRIPHQGRVVIEDDVHIGACCTIDRATFGETRIEQGAKFDNHIHIGHNCRIGRNALLTAGFTIAGSSKIGANFVTGGKSVVTGHIEVCDNVQLAALTAVSKSITEPGQYGGNPLQPLQKFIKTKVIITQLPAMRKQLRQALKKLGIQEESED